MNQLAGNHSKYRVELLPEGEGAYTALHPELPGCVAWGDSVEEALANLEGSREAWIEGRLEYGFEVPAPAGEEEASGRVTLRLPKFVHAELVQVARRETVSLNSLISTALTAFVSGAANTKFFREPSPWSSLPQDWIEIVFSDDFGATDIIQMKDPIGGSLGASNVRQFALRSVDSADQELRRA